MSALQRSAAAVAQTFSLRYAPVLLAIWLAGPAFAQYSITPVVTSGGGYGGGVGGVYGVSQTTGQPALGTGTSASYSLVTGFWPAVNSSPETVVAGNTTWAGGGSLTWQLNDALGTAGSDPGWDWQNITGTLTISATSGSKFTTYLATLAGNTAGSAANFNNAHCYAWPIATASVGISGFAADAFTVNTNGFLNPVLAQSFFSVSNYNQSVYVVYTPENPTFDSPTVDRNFYRAVDVTFEHLAGLAAGVATVKVNCSVVGTAYDLKGDTLASGFPVNYDTPNTGFPPGTTKVKFTATKPDDAAASVALFVFDAFGHAGKTDPAFLNLIVPAGGVVEQRLTGIPPVERYLRVFNGQPGLRSLAITVNGQPVSLGALVDGESRALDLGAFLAEGENNTLVFTGRGELGASAFLVLAETPTAGQLVAAPALAVALTKEGVALSWPDLPSRWQLQARLALDGAWENVPATPAVLGGRNTVALSLGAESRFFRLQAASAAAASAPAQGSSARLSGTNSQPTLNQTYDAITW